MKPSVSVIICTYNRSKSLEDALESLASMEIHSDFQWELFVIDNNSKDATHAVVENFAKKATFKVSYLFEKTQGLSYARNRGICASNSDYIVFTDDDVIVDKMWLENIFRAFVDYSADCVGGRILPIWLGKRPTWLKDDLLNVLAVLDLGSMTFQFKKGTNSMLYGANFAFKRELFELYGKFDTRLGRKYSYGGGEDEFLFKKLIAGDKKIIYNPDILVWHKIFRERLTKKYFRKWHLKSSIDVARVNCARHRSIIGIPYYMMKDLILHFWGYMCAVMRSQDKAFQYELRLLSYFGFFFEKVRAVLQ